MDESPVLPAPNLPLVVFEPQEMSDLIPQSDPLANVDQVGYPAKFHPGEVWRIAAKSAKLCGVGDRKSDLRKGAGRRPGRRLW